VALDEVDPLDDDAVVLARGRATLPVLPLSLPLMTTTVSPLRMTRGHHSTSGASEMIFMNFLARSSRATGPEDARPDGLALLVDEHGAVLVEADVAAVGARHLVARRTTTACATSPFFTFVPGSASLMETTMTSPRARRTGGASRRAP
jgi:hypothetical protein